MQIKLVVALLTMFFASLVRADTEQTPLLKKNINLVESFSSQWGVAAIKIPSKPAITSLHEWSTNTSTQGLMASINSNVTPNLKVSQAQFFTGINAGYYYGRFYAETGLLSQTSDVSDSGKFYLQGSYSVYIKDNFDLALMAKYQATEPAFFDNYVSELEPMLDPQTLFIDDTQQATIGIISTYSITKQWKLLGSLTTTSFNKSITHSPLSDINNKHMALFGTSYSF